MLFNVDECSYAPTIVSFGDHDHSTQFELDNVGHFSSFNIDLDGVVDLDIWVGVADGASVVGDSDGDLSGSDVDLVDPAELVLGLLAVDSLKDETSLGVEQEAEAISALFQFDDVHKSSREVVIGADLSVDLDATFHADLHALSSGNGIIQAFTEDDANGQTFAHFVGTLGRSGGKNAPHLSEVPMIGRIKALKVLLWSARPVRKSKQQGGW